ncbi:hypothetical protein Tco_1028443 [Tanacetum coccineum]|uniref:EF-hand domain-containing protein n=1 Tax=Tanacetum coccineum TaxID=301880 RepID=A0ABQ5G2S3_9ASTR
MAPDYGVKRIFKGRKSCKSMRNGERELYNVAFYVARKFGRVSRLIGTPSMRVLEIDTQMSLPTSKIGYPREKSLSSILRLTSPSGLFHNSIVRWLSLCSETALAVCGSSLSSGSQNTQLLQLPDASSTQWECKTMVFGTQQSHAHCTFERTASDIQITTSGCVKRMSLLDADSDIFQRYSQLCAHNVRPRFLADFPEAGYVNNFEPHANYYSQLCVRNAGAAIPEQHRNLLTTAKIRTSNNKRNVITTGTPPSSPKSKHQNTKHRVMTTTATAVLHRQAAADNQPQKEICRKVADPILYGEILAAALHMNNIDQQANILTALCFFYEHGSGHITKNELEEAGNKFLTDGAPRGFKVDQKLMQNTQLPTDIKANVVVAKD